MPIMRILVVGLILGFVQADAPYVRRGEEVEALFGRYSDALDGFFDELRETVAMRAPELLDELDREDAPPEPGVYGYQILPPIVPESDPSRREGIGTFSYSWPITERYIDSERLKLDAARGALSRIRRADSSSRDVLLERIEQYRTLVDNLETIDQYLQYNRLWQRAIADNPARFDRMTELYETLVSETSADAGRVLRDLLGHPEVPDFVEVERLPEGSTHLRLPVYTDIADDAFLDKVEEGVESMWSVADDPGFALDIEFRKVSPHMLYPAGHIPVAGEPIELTDHASRFPAGGAVLTTGAESTYGFVGRYVALGPGAITVRTLAHEFGHVLGFPDGYVRGYRDLGEEGFEILELTSGFDDIMSAPREGRVLGSHFELMIESIERQGR